MAMENSLKHRLLQDIAELQKNPYPKVCLVVDERDITKACLILTVDGYGSMHMSVEFPVDYPLSPPQIRMDSEVHHPNILGSYVCASILNTTEGYTPAYTLKGIAIQLLSFFGSDSIEQDYGGKVNLGKYRDTQSYILGGTYKCNRCVFGSREVSISGLSLSSPRGVNSPTAPPPPPGPDSNGSAAGDWPLLSEASAQASSPKRKRSARSSAETNAMVRVKVDQPARVSSDPPKTINDIPDEVLLMVIEKLETEEVWKFRDACDRIGGVILKYDVIRTRELQCFCLKKDYLSVKLGVGVNVVKRGKFGSFESEFDLLSSEGFYTHGIQRSVQGIPFTHYLPLPISHGHWRKVRESISARLGELAEAAGLGNVAPVKVIYSFMSDVVVKLNQQASEPAPSSVPHYLRSYERHNEKSTLTHASEKAIESYFHLFHLLLCLASEDIGIVNAANRTLHKFASGANSKDACPNLGQLLVAALVSSVEMTEGMLKSIIKETITRNVVWMLDKRGANMPELSYMEPATVSYYRLQKTFEASKTSYRLLMFLNLFRRVAVGHPRKPLALLRDEAFIRHGAPPMGSAKGLAEDIKRIHQISTFPSFLKEMGIGAVSAEWFTTFLKDCIDSSAKKGYHRMPITQGQALWLRQKKEPNVRVAGGVSASALASWEMDKMSFFPGQNTGGGNIGGGGGGRGGGGGGRGARGGGWRGAFGGR